MNAGYRGPLLPVFLSLLLLAACGRARTEKLLTTTVWAVTDVTPPPGSGFNIEDKQRAEELKEGFYRGAWFRFLADSLFVAHFGNRTDTGKYAISASGKTIQLYPRQGGQMYEQLQILELTKDRLAFNTLLADFHLTLHLRAGQP